MRNVSFKKGGKTLRGVRKNGVIRTLGEATLEGLLAQGVDLGTWAATQSGAGSNRPKGWSSCPPAATAEGSCVGLNFADHTTESK